MAAWSVVSSGQKFTKERSPHVTSGRPGRPHLPSLGRRTPISTYRLQLGPDLTFDQVRAQLPYLDALGVTDLYLSPILAAAPGSTHGYDVVDHTRVSEVMGGRAAFERLAEAAHARGLGVIVDVVPNHMAVPSPLWHNRALWSVLKEGPRSAHAAWFDGTDSADGILLPVLGARIGTVLANGELIAGTEVVPGEEDAGPQPVLRYFDHVFPVRAGTEHLPLPECVQAQYYRLAYWKVADEELNFRRFFDVDTLVAVRVEDPAVFDATHALLLELYDAGHIDGFRIDHPDGLADPRGYLRRLAAATGGAWVAAEKILEGDEETPDDWPVAGTTGYDAAWRIDALQLDPAGQAHLANLALELSGDVPGSLPQVIAAAKREITTSSLFAEVHRIATLAYGICRDDIMLRDHTFRWIRDCITELVVAFPRYRAYVVPGEEASAAAVALVEETAEVAAGRLDPELRDTLSVVVDLVLGREVGAAGRQQRDLRDELIVRFQQVCGAVQAKGVEDTAYYRWNQLVSLCEVGSPVAWGLNPDAFHAWCADMAERRPATMTAGTTHDTKRSEDVRTRIGALSRYAEEWRALLNRVAPHLAGVEGHTANLLWQTIAGTWTEDGPIELDRLLAYARKAAREQKLWTSWTNPDAAGEAALDEALTGLLADPDAAAAFTEWFALTEDAVADAILVRKALQLTCVGVADVYQGSETLTNSLVDPDNRRPVDFDALAATLKRLRRAKPRSLAEAKLRLTHRLLDLRRRRPGAFVGPDAPYRPLPTSTGQVVAFARGAASEVVVLALRSPLSGAGTEHTAVLPRGPWVDVLSGLETKGGTVPVAKLFADAPVVVLERADG